MAHNILSTISERGVRAIFNDALDTVPQVWRQNVLEVQSDKADEKHVWMGSVPIPKEFKGEYEFEGFAEYSITLVNDEYTLAFTVDLNTLRDESEGQIMRRVQDVAESYATLKDSQFADLLIGGEASTATFDAATFFLPTRTIGDSGTINNDLTDATVTTPTLMLDAVQTLVQAMREYTDDRGRVGFTAAAMQSMRIIVPAELERFAIEAMNSTVVNNNSNPWGQGLAEIDVLPYLTSAAKFYLSAVGSPSKRGIIHQQREPLSISVFNSQDELIANHGMRVIARERYKMGYGDPRLLSLVTLS